MVLPLTLKSVVSSEGSRRFVGSGALRNLLFMLDMPSGVGALLLEDLTL